MGTNYYLHQGVCAACEKPERVLHIGKSSAGWCFSLRVRDPSQSHHDEERAYPTSLAEWALLWDVPGCRIVNEYGARVSSEDMMRCVTERGAAVTRHDVDGRYVLAHGEGTYDLTTGDFS